LLMNPIPATGEMLPAVGLGSYQTFDVGERQTERAGPRAVLEAFAASGGRLVDSSPMYGNAETVIGDSLADAQAGAQIDGAMFIATKVWTRGRDAGLRQMTESMRKLRRERVDLMQVHNLLDVDTHLQTLREWQHEGRTRYVGITHYTASAHDEVAAILRRHPLDFLQINYSLVEREAEDLLLPLAAQRGVAVIVNRPFAGGALLNRTRRKPVPSEARELGCESWSEWALKFVLSHPAVTCVIPATSNPAHLKEFIKATDGPMPDATTRKRIAAAIEL